MGNMRQGGVSVGMMSHKCGRYETGWGKCGKKKGRVRMKSVRVVTQYTCVIEKAVTQTKELPKGHKLSDIGCWIRLAW